MITISKIVNNVNANPIQTTFETLSSHITSNDWSPASFANNYRNLQNFQSLDILVYDIDSKLSLSEAISIVKPYNHIIATTKSHQKLKNNLVCDRYRVILKLSSQISNKEVYADTWHHYNTNLFNNSVDLSCKDPSRFYYASNEVVSYNFIGMNVTPQRNKPKPVIQRINTSNHGKLSVKTLNFINNGEILPEGRNHTLYKCLIDAREQGYNEDECYNMFEQPLQDTGFFDQYGVTKFEATLKQVFNKDLRYPPRIPVPTIQVEQPKKKVKDDFFNDIVYILDDVFKDKYTVVTDDEGRKYPLKLIGNNQVAKISLADLVNEYTRHFVGTDFNRGIVTNEKAVKTWVASTSSMSEKPDYVGFKDTTNLVYHRLDFDPTPGECPTFTTMLSNIYNADALCAYIWSALVKECKTHQVIYWFGLGGDGKGSLTKVLKFIFGNAMIGTSSQDEKSNRQFFMSSLIGKRVVILSDENNTKVMMSSWFKRLSGGDPIMINPKNESPYCITLEPRLFIFSNHEPEYDASPAMMRRVIYCKSLYDREYEFDPRFYDKLQSELPQILWHCKQKYDILCIDNGIIKCETDLSYEIAEQIDFDKKEFLDRYFLTGADKEMKKSDLQNFFKSRLSQRFSYQDFIKYLRVSKIMKEIRRDNVRMALGLCLK